MALPIATYEAIERINHDSKPYEVGDILELDENHAKVLLERGVIKRTVITLTKALTKE